MWGALRPAGVVGAPGQGGGLPHLRKMAVVLGAGEGAELGGFPAGPLVPRGMPTGRRGLWPLLQAPLAPLPPSERARLPPHAGRSLRSCPAWSRNAVPWAVPQAAPSHPPALARRPAPRWALPDLHPGRGLHTSAASLSPEDWSPSAVVFQMAVVSLHPPGRKEMRAGRGLVCFFCFVGRILVP